ncbi:NYN domain-containing protein [Tistrella mobilis]|uniref:NYN domain-containing protein n=1 Tax=Tistrella mobilis TaxID=171437 RepID=UPI003557C0B6
MSTAILIDGAFFLVRLNSLYHAWPGLSDPDQVATIIHRTALGMLKQGETEARRNLYRIFFYDCPPLQKRVTLPVSRQTRNYAQTDMATFRLSLHARLREKRKMALRLGTLKGGTSWRLKAPATQELLKGRRGWASLTDDDFELDLRQKGVDMRIGLDMASLTLKRFVDQIILISGDADFVPAAKLARREGVDVILNPLWKPIPEDLNEHIDGLRNYLARYATPAAAEADAVPSGADDLLET